MDNEMEYLMDEEEDDEELQEFDVIAEEFKRILEQSDNTAYVLDPKRFNEMDYVYRVMKKLVRGTGAKVTYDLGSGLTPSFGSVSVEGKIFGCTNSNLFCKAAAYADNMDVYAKTNGNVCIDFGFYRLAKKI